MIAERFTGYPLLGTEDPEDMLERAEQFASQGNVEATKHFTDEALRTIASKEHETGWEWFLTVYRIHVATRKEELMETALNHHLRGVAEDTLTAIKKAKESGVSGSELYNHPVWERVEEMVRGLYELEKRSIKLHPETARAYIEVFSEFPDF
ncbi:MAG TPA: hypothetical protein ENG42_03465 [Candidatus Aenigmarchaeota archaeon]|nr:hypothetical protein [Candidatus Aenigmarchaeota archaeon]